MFFYQPFQHTVQPGDTVFYYDDRSESNVRDRRTCQPVHVYLYYSSIIFLHMRLLWIIAIAYVVPRWANSPTLTCHFRKAFLHTDHQRRATLTKVVSLRGGVYYTMAARWGLTPWEMSPSWRKRRRRCRGRRVILFESAAHSKKQQAKNCLRSLPSAIPASVPTH